MGQIGSSESESESNLRPRHPEEIFSSTRYQYYIISLYHTLEPYKY